MTKDQAVLANEGSLIDSAIHRQQLREQNEVPRSDKARATSRLMSAVHSLTSEQEVSLHQAAFALTINDRPVYSTAKFAPLLLLQHVSASKGHPIVATFTASSKGNFVVATQVDDYTLRPVELGHLNAYDLTSQFQKISLKRVGQTKKKRTNETKTSAHGDEMELDEAEEESGEEEALQHSLRKRRRYRFRPDHPQAQTHCMVERSQPVVPEIVGQRLPSLDDCAADESAAEEYARSAMLLFRPHRTHDDLLSGEQTWRRAFDKWKHTPSFTDEIARYLENMQDYYIGRQKAREQRDSSNAGGFGGEDDGPNAPRSHCANQGENDLFDTDSLPLPLDAGMEEAAVFSSLVGSLKKDSWIVDIAEKLQQSGLLHPLAAAPDPTAPNSAAWPTVDHTQAEVEQRVDTHILRQQVETARPLNCKKNKRRNAQAEERDEELPLLPVPPAHPRPTHFAIEEMEEALQNSRVTQQSLQHLLKKYPADHQLSSKAALREVFVRLTLSDEQQIVVQKVATALVRSLRPRPAGSEDNKQLLMLLNGMSVFQIKNVYLIAIRISRSGQEQGYFSCHPVCFVMGCY